MPVAPSVAARAASPPDQLCGCDATNRTDVIVRPAAEALGMSVEIAVTATAASLKMRVRIEMFDRHTRQVRISVQGK